MKAREFGTAGPTGIILAAGAGSRLRDVAPSKPLVEVGGRPLVLHAIRSMQAAGVAEVVVVVGWQGERIRAALDGVPGRITLVNNPLWAETPNGVSLLQAKEYVRPGSLLMMADHLLSAALMERLLAGAARPLALAVDRQLGHPWVDEADVTRVRTENGAIRAIGKQLAVYDCYDTGLFRIGPELVSALESLPSPGLSEGVSILARRGQAQAVDIGGAPWLDVDDARALAIARTAWRAEWTVEWRAAA